MRRLITLIAATSLFMGVLAPGALARATTETDVVKNATETFVDRLPCVGGRAEITITYNGVFHYTETDNGTHFTGTLTGTFVADPLTAGLPTYRGRFTQWFGDNVNRVSGNGCFTFTVIGRASDGSRVKFHETAHFAENRNGIVVEFDKFRCH